MRKKIIPWSEILQYTLLILTTILLLVYVFHLSEIDLRFPLLSGNGDVLSHVYLYKTIMETGWIYINPSTGAPFSATFFDYPGSDGLHIVFILVISLFVRDPMKVYNLYYLIGFLLAALSSFYVIKKMGIPFFLALPGAVSFSFLPFHFLRYAHSFLASYYMVPLGIFITIEVLNGSLNLIFFDPENIKIRLNIGRPKNLVYLFVCFLIASSGVYYAYFVAVIALISTIKYFVFEGSVKRLNLLANGTLVVAVILISAAINSAPTFIYTFINGSPTEIAVFRSSSFAEVFGLKIAQMLLPSPIHRFSPLAEITNVYNSSTPLVNENATAALGIIGVVGFLYSLLLFLMQWKKNMLDEQLSFINIVSVLIATIGGFGSIIAFFVLPFIRAYNRISVVIGFVSIILFSRLFLLLLNGIEKKSLRGKENYIHVVRVGVSFFLLIVVFLDQAFVPGFKDTYEVNKTIFENDQKFASEIEQILPSGSMIFQLPFMSFPENGPIEKMGDYDHFKPYLHTDGLHWSYGDSKGRISSDWNRTTAGLPVEKMLQRLVLVGFSGIYVDRFGYEDSGAELETEIRQYINLAPIMDSGHRYVFYDIREYADQYLSQFGDVELQELTESAYYIEPKISIDTGCFSGNNDSGRLALSCGNKSELIVSDYENSERIIVLDFKASTIGGNSSLLTIEYGDAEERYELSGNLLPIHLAIPMRADRVSEKIMFSIDDHWYDLWINDPNDYKFKLSNLVISVEYP